jgi:hypothetical protein
MNPKEKEREKEAQDELGEYLFDLAKDVVQKIHKKSFLHVKENMIRGGTRPPNISEFVSFESLNLIQFERMLNGVYTDLMHGALEETAKARAGGGIINDPKMRDVILKATDSLFAEMDAIKKAEEEKRRWEVTK